MDKDTARTMLVIARTHLDRRCNECLPANIEYELASILSEESLAGMHAEARALLNESRGLS